MKVIVLDRDIKSDVSETLFPSGHLIADSAISVSGRPVFLPDLGSSCSWEASIYMAFRISRLGKGIERRYASRYIDAMTIALEIGSSDKNFRDSVAGHSFDGVLSTGTWMELGDGFPGMVTVSVADSSGHIALDTSIGIEEIGIEEAIASLSRYLTLKNGDILMPMRLWHGPIGPTRITASIDNRECLRKRII